MSSTSIRGGGRANEDLDCEDSRLDARNSRHSSRMNRPLRNLNYEGETSQWDNVVIGPQICDIGWDGGDGVGKSQGGLAIKPVAHMHFEMMSHGRSEQT